MKKGIIFIIVAMMLSTMACSFTVNIPSIKTGPEKTVEINEPLPSSDNPIEVELNVGAAKLNVSGGAKDLVNGTVTYNVPDWVPEVTFSDDRLVIGQKETNITGFPSEQLINKWDIQLTNKIPLDININAGAYQGDLELGGMNITNLKINDGASDTKVSFATPNNGTMDKLDYSSGASTVELTGLGNANFEKMQFSAGAGSYTLDFSGELQQDADVNIEAGVSSIKIIIPEGTRAEIVVEGELKDVSTRGTWTVESNTYSTEGTGKLFKIYVNMNLGSLELLQK